MIGLRTSYICHIVPLLTWLLSFFSTSLEGELHVSIRHLTAEQNKTHLEQLFSNQTPNKLLSLGLKGLIGANQTWPCNFMGTVWGSSPKKQMLLSWAWEKSLAQEECVCQYQAAHARAEPLRSHLVVQRPPTLQDLRKKAGDTVLAVQGRASYPGHENVRNITGQQKPPKTQCNIDQRSLHTSTHVSLLPLLMVFSLVPSVIKQYNSNNFCTTRFF